MFHLISKTTDVGNFFLSIFALFTYKCFYCVSLQFNDLIVLYSAYVHGTNR